MLLRRLTYPNTTGLILRRTFPELYKSHIIKLFEEYPEIWPLYNAQRGEIALPNGSRLFFGSAQFPKDMSAFYSAEFADIMPDEAQEFTQNELERLTGSLRCTSNADITPKLVCTFMPGMSEANVPPVGLTYLKRVFADGKLEGNELKSNWRFIQAFSWDNIELARKELDRDGVSEDEFYSWSEEMRRDYFITRTEYGITLASMTDVDLRDAWLYGKWDAFKGQYFPRFSQERHVITKVEAMHRIKPWHRFSLSGDWGYEHRHAVYIHCVDENNRVITFGEQCARAMGEIELAGKIAELSAGYKCRDFVFSWDAGKLSKRANPKFPKSISQMIAEALPAGIPKPAPADSSPGSRIARARLTSELLDSDMWQMTEDCTALIECLPTLLRDPDNPEDVLKVDFSENRIGDDPYDGASMGLQHLVGSAVVPARVRLERQLTAVRQTFVPQVVEQKPGEQDFFAKFGGARS